MKSISNNLSTTDSDLRKVGFCGENTAVRTDSLILAANETPNRRFNNSFRREETIDSLGSPERVFLPDQRKKIVDTTVAPYASICSLEIVNDAGEVYYGTGFLAGPRLLITAGHNVYFHGEGFMKTISVYPGLNADRDRPMFRKASSSSFRTVEAWTSNGDRQFDIGAILLPTNLGDDVGWFSLGNYTTNTIDSLTANVCGYPLDVQNADIPDDASTMWIDSGKFKRVESNRMLYTLDTSSGQSGAPVFAFFPDLDDPYHAIGVHNTYYSDENACTRFNDSIFAILEQWRDESES